MLVIDAWRGTEYLGEAPRESVVLKNMNESEGGRLVAARSESREEGQSRAYPEKGKTSERSKR